jgi:hypothetical protein
MNGSIPRRRLDHDSLGSDIDIDAALRHTKAAAPNSP